MCSTPSTEAISSSNGSRTSKQHDVVAALWSEGQRAQNSVGVSSGTTASCGVPLEDEGLRPLRVDQRRSTVSNRLCDRDLPIGRRVIRPSFHDGRAADDDEQPALRP